MDHATYIYGVTYPNRIFVGGLPRETTASELATFFCTFGQVTETKVILNEDRSSKGYGFVTFATPEDVEAVSRLGTIFFKQKKLNIGPAIRKQAPETLGEPILIVNPPSKTLHSSPPPQAPTPPTMSSPVQHSPPITFGGENFTNIINQQQFSPYGFGAHQNMLYHCNMPMAIPQPALWPLV